MTQRAIQFFVLYTLVLSLSGCGWQLRGQVPDGGELSLQAVHLLAAADNPVAQKLESQLMFRGIQMVNSAASGALSLDLDEPATDRRVLTVSADVKARQIGVRMRINYRVLNSEGEILAADALDVVREFTQNPLQPATATREQEALETEMADQLATDLMRIISRYAYAASEDQT